MKRGYHSTQTKCFGTVPRSEFLGLTLGFALGMFFTGLLRLDGSVLEIAGAAAGFAVGYWIDGRYFAEKDIPVGDEQEDEQAGGI